jgi:superoxide dismutase
MTPNGGGTPPEAIAEAIDNSFGSFDDFKKSFV